MLTIIWNPCRFRLIRNLEKGLKFNADSYKARILSLLSEWYSIAMDSNERKLKMHADNSRSHTAKISNNSWRESNEMNVTPSVFVWSPATGLLSVQQGQWMLDRFLVWRHRAASWGVSSGARGYWKAAIPAIFLEWMCRLRKCIVSDREYPNSAKIKVMEEYSLILPVLRCSPSRGTPGKSGINLLILSGQGHRDWGHWVGSVETVQPNILIAANPGTDSRVDQGRDGAKDSVSYINWSAEMYDEASHSPSW
jgi:hypothetical protein